MAKYTTQVKTICETMVGVEESGGYNEINNIIKNAVPKVFNFDFPIFDEEYRHILCGKILKEYYMKEICAETVGVWKYFLDARLNSIMPYYNQLYKSQLLEFNPFYDMEMTRDYTRTDDGSDSKSEVVNNDSTNVLNGSLVIDNTERDIRIADNERSSTDNIVKDVTFSQDKDITNKEKQDNVKDVVVDNLADTKNDSTVKGTKWLLENDTPQGGISKVGIDDNSYLTKANKNTDDTLVKDVGNVKSKATTKDKTTNTNDLLSNTKEKGSNKDSTTGSGLDKEKINETDTKTVNGINTKNDVATTSSSSFSSLTGDKSNLETYFEKVKGKTGSASYSKMLQEFRETFLNIDKMVLEELTDLFMLIY